MLKSKNEPNYNYIPYVASGVSGLGGIQGDGEMIGQVNVDNLPNIGFKF